MLYLCEPKHIACRPRACLVHLKGAPRLLLPPAANAVSPLTPLPTPMPPCCFLPLQASWSRGVFRAVLEADGPKVEKKEITIASTPFSGLMNSVSWLETEKYRSYVGKEEAEFGCVASRSSPALSASRSWRTRKAP